MKKLVSLLFAIFASVGIFAQPKNTQTINIEFGEKSYA